MSASATDGREAVTRTQARAQMIRRRFYALLFRELVKANTPRQLLLTA